MLSDGEARAAAPRPDFAKLSELRELIARADAELAQLTLDPKTMREVRQLQLGIRTIYDRLWQQTEQLQQDHTNQQGER